MRWSSRCRRVVETLGPGDALSEKVDQAIARHAAVASPAVLQAVVPPAVLASVTAPRAAALAPPEVIPAPAVAAQRADRLKAWQNLIAGLVWPALVGMAVLYGRGYAAIDSPTPDIETARLWWGLTGGAAVVLAGVATAARVRYGWVAIPIAAVLAVLPGAWIAGGASMDYGPHGFFGVAVLFYGGLTLGVILLIAVVMAMATDRRHPNVGWIACVSIALAVAFAVAGAAVHHMMTIEHHAELAQKAWARRSSPALPIIGAIAAMLGAAAWTRRR